MVARLSWSGRIKVTERFPLTEQGWASAWRVLAGRDAQLEAIQADLAVWYDRPSCTA